MSQQDFAAKLAISPASLSSIYTGRTNPTNNHVQAVHRAFPDVNINWLLFGEGEMRTAATGSMGGGAAPDVVEFDSMDGDGRQANFAGRNTQSGMSSMFPDDSNTANFEPSSAASFPAHPALMRSERRSSSTKDTYAAKSAKIIDNIPRKIKEIRVFFDDGTYEAFVPSSK